MHGHLEIPTGFSVSELVTDFYLISLIWSSCNFSSLYHLFPLSTPRSLALVFTRKNTPGIFQCWKMCQSQISECPQAAKLRLQFLYFLKETHSCACWWERKDEGCTGISYFLNYDLKSHLHEAEWNPTPQKERAKPDQWHALEACWLGASLLCSLPL